MYNQWTNSGRPGAFRPNTWQSGAGRPPPYPTGPYTGIQPPWATHQPPYVSPMSTTPASSYALSQAYSSSPPFSSTQLYSPGQQYTSSLPFSYQTSSNYPFSQPSQPSSDGYLQSKIGQNYPLNQSSYMTAGKPYTTTSQLNSQQLGTFPRRSRSTGLAANQYSSNIQQTFTLSNFGLPSNQLKDLKSTLWPGVGDSTGVTNNTSPSVYTFSTRDTSPSRPTSGSKAQDRGAGMKPRGHSAPPWAVGNYANGSYPRKAYLPPIDHQISNQSQARSQNDINMGAYNSMLSATYAMGQTLSEPVTTKYSSKHENSFVKVGSSCMQGWRINMEDAHSHLLSLPGDKDACFFGVFDGHGGVKVAQYAGNNLHKKIVSQSAYNKGHVSDAIRHGFLALDEEMLKDDQMKDELAGTTAVVVLIKNGKLICGNVGDSRAIASVHGEVEQLSFDHKPSNEVETRRIIAAGGWVEFNRVNGNLALSRALGDFVFKKNDKKRPEDQIVTANPDVIERPITADHEFVVLACDGIWDVLTNQEVVEFVRNRIAQRMEPDTICEELMTRCLAPDCQAGGLGCDNMTVVLVCFLQGGTYEDLVRKCARPSRAGPAPHLRDFNVGFEFK